MTYTHIAYIIDLLYKNDAKSNSNELFYQKCGNRSNACVEVYE
jgi:hypothetical protein